MLFHALALHKRILDAVDDAGYSEATPIQAKTIPPILEGKDLIGLAQTGTGKDGSIYTALAF